MLLQLLGRRLLRVVVVLSGQAGLNTIAVVGAPIYALILHMLLSYPNYFKNYPTWYRSVWNTDTNWYIGALYVTSVVKRF